MASLVTENSNMGNLANVGSMEASSRNGSDEIASYILDTYRCAVSFESKPKKINMVF